jgi:hypothetical protein
VSGETYSGDGGATREAPSLSVSLSCFSLMFSLLCDRGSGGLQRCWWRPLVVVVAAYGGGGGDLPAPWWVASRFHLSPVLLLPAGGLRRWWWVGARTVGRPAGLRLFFCFTKIPSLRARWASRHMSAERPRMLSVKSSLPVQRRLEAFAESFLSGKDSMRGKTLSARVSSLLVKGANPVVICALVWRFFYHFTLICRHAVLVFNLEVTLKLYQN